MQMAPNRHVASPGSLINEVWPSLPLISRWLDLLGVLLVVVLLLLLS